MGCCGGGNQMNYRESSSNKQSNSADILKNRLIKGEISVDEYERTLRVLNLEEKPTYHTSHAMKAE